MHYMVKINLIVMVAKKIAKQVQMDVGIAQNVLFLFAGHALKEAKNFGRSNLKNKNKIKIKFKLNDCIRKSTKSICY